MAFLYSAIGDNTIENRHHLEKIGIKSLCGVEGNIIIVHNANYVCVTIEGEIGNNFFDSINCIGNPQLFQAVSAMRDDSDYMQWFKTDFENKLIPDVKEMYLCKSKEFCGITVKYKVDDFVIGSAGFHKATLSELQLHFKRV